MQHEMPLRSAQAIRLAIHQRAILIVLLFITALSIRLYRIDEPPLNFHATRQYRSLLIARSYYYAGLPGLPDWQREVSQINRERQGLLEPPVMELLAAAGYRIWGGERFWIPRLFSILFWLVGGVFLYRIARELSGANAALFSTAVYLFLPFSVIASRSFQPDPLMVMLVLASVYAGLRYARCQSFGRLALVSVLSASAIFIKPVSGFIIFSVFVSLIIYQKKTIKALLNPGLLGFFGITLLPALLFYLFGFLTGRTLQVQAQASFLPQLLLDGFFWRNWLEKVGSVIGFAAFLGALLGVLLFPKGLPRYLMAGLWAGYVLFCLTFNYHIATHDYYHLQLIPIVALSIGPIFSLVTDRLMEINREWYWRTAIGFIVLIAFGLLAFEARPRPLDRSLLTKVGEAKEIGQKVNHTTNSIYLASDYGLSLEYHGEISGHPWPLASDLHWERLAKKEVLRAEERFRAWFSSVEPVFFIITDLGEFEQQQDLVTFLSENASLLVVEDSYRIYSLYQ